MEATGVLAGFSSLRRCFHRCVPSAVVHQSVESYGPFPVGVLCFSKKL